MLKVLKFSADWCGPCRMLQPTFEKVSNDFSDVNFVTIDIDEEQDRASEYKIRAVPTIVFEKDGKEVDRLVGLVSEDIIRKTIEGLK